MAITTYDKPTRARIEKFLRKRETAITSELVRLGGKKRVINWHSFKLIMTDLTREGHVKKTKLGKKVRVYEWIGGK